MKWVSLSKLCQFVIILLPIFCQNCCENFFVRIHRIKLGHTFFFFDKLISLIRATDVDTHMTMITDSLTLMMAMKKEKLKRVILCGWTLIYKHFLWYNRDKNVINGQIYVVCNVSLILRTCSVSVWEEKTFYIKMQDRHTMR